jgi:DNA-binding beta-propeller fold protein YncE
VQTKRLISLVCIVLAALLLTACITVQPGTGGGPATRTDRVWPPPPAAARIRLVRTISTPRDLGITKSFFRRLLDRISGGSGVQLVRPSGVAEHAGVLYVADPGAQSLWLFDPGSNQATRVQQVDGTALVSPVAVAVRADGAAFVADSRAAKVYLVDRRGKYLGLTIQAGLQRPAALAWDDRGGRLYVADSAGQRIIAFDAQGRQLFAWGRRGSGAGEFNYPTHLALAGDGELLVTDALNFRIQSFDRDGRFLWQFGRHGDGSGNFAMPKGVAVDSGRHVYVVDALFNAVQLFDRDGTYLMSFGDQGSAPGQFWLPGGLYIDDKDRIYIADAYNRRVQVFEFIHPGANPGAEHRQ